MASSIQQVWELLAAGGQGLANQFHGLTTADDLLVTENMWIEAANCEASKARNLQICRGRGIDTVFLLDISESMADEGLAQMKKVVLEILESIEGCKFAHQREENVAIVTFGHTTFVDCHLTNDYKEIRASLDQLFAGGRSPMLAGMYMALCAIAARGTETVINSVSVHPRIILISDGQATDSEVIHGTDRKTQNLPADAWESIVNLAIRLGADHHPISCVPVGNANEDFLLEIASKSGGHLVQQHEVQRIGRYFKNLTEVTSMKRKHDLTTKDPEVFAQLARSMLTDVKDADIEEMMLILLETDNLSSCKTQEDEIVDPQMPLMGSRVRRGKDWMWGDQDLSGPGTITGHCNQIGWLTVEWDLNHMRGRYRYGADEKFDLSLTQEPRILQQDELIGTGCLVCRDKDWSYGHQDGGPTNIGVVFDVNTNGIVRVRWPNGHMNSYKYGCEGMFDVQIWHPEESTGTPSTWSSSSGTPSIPPTPHYPQLHPPSTRDSHFLEPSHRSIPSETHPLHPTHQSMPSNAPELMPIHPTQQSATYGAPEPEFFDPTIQPPDFSVLEPPTNQITRSSDTSMQGLVGSPESSKDIFKSLGTEVKDDDLFPGTSESSIPAGDLKAGGEIKNLAVEQRTEISDSNLAGTPSPESLSSSVPVFTHKSVSWQFQPPGGTWQSYSDDISQKIEEKFQKNNKTTLIRIDTQEKSNSYRIILKGKLRQTHVKSNGKNAGSVEPDCAVRRLEVPNEIWEMDKEKVDLYFAALEKGQETLTNLRLMVVGHEGVGKTTLCHHLMKIIIPENLESTNGIDIYIHRYLINMKSKKQTPLPPDRQEEAACLRLAKVVASFKHENDMIGENVVVDSDQHPDLRSLGSIAGAESPKQDVLESMPLTSETSDMTTEKQWCQSIVDEELQDQRSYSSDESYINKYRYPKPNISSTWNNTGKPRERKITNFFRNDMVNVIQKSEGEEEGEEKAYLSVWDFGGQKVFYDSHHIFLSKDAVYIVCFNVSDCHCDVIKKKAEFERARFWLHSIGTLSTRQNTETVELPPIILVGTHMDKLEGMDDDAKKVVFFDMCSILLKPPELQKIKNHIQGYCPVDNSNPNLPWLPDLWEDIIKAAPYQSQWQRALPAKWLSLERELMKLKGQGQKIMTFEEVTKLDGKLESPIENTKEIELFLEYLHETGNIMFFKEEIDGEGMMNRKLVLDPQWIVYAFRCLITDSKFTQFDSTNLDNMWKMYHVNAELLQPLVDALWRGDSFREHKAILLTLMENLGLISRPKSLSNIKVNEKAQYYIVPTILKESSFDWLELVLKEVNTVAQSRTLCLVYEFLPFTIFHKLLAACIGHYKIAAYLTQEGVPLQKGFGCFMVGLHWHMILHCKNSVVKVTMFKYVETENEKKIKAGELVSVREFLEDTLKKILGRNQLSHLTFQYELHCKFWCGENENRVGKETIHQESRVRCCGSPKQHFFGLEDLSPWFGSTECGTI
ncbi:uncharacterized protein LOC132559928 [Ylistrum balloti]|uniref:uncharacterized protein LOC132559928 n=1 Tax=Ylistrum balloti TaxID=509963 RepID=UPI00290589C7|nr:uncharacterized protein LOC132559928 [Ylistrum balloti]